MDFLYQIVERIWDKRLAFFTAFFIVFTVTYAALFVADFLPEAPATDGETADVVQNDETEIQVASETESFIEVATNENSDEITEVAAVIEEVQLPLTISIKKLDKIITVLNPISRTIADLDEALLGGVVRHPDSATLTQEGNVFILGHSSHLPNIFNKNFQAFNGIEDLAWGDIIEVTSQDNVYKYRVEKVYRANAQELTVPIAGTGHKLTLATCNSFGSVDDRFIVEATRIDVRAL